MEPKRPHPMTTTNQTHTNVERTTTQPVCFPLPSRGGDPHFGLSRSYYYGLEKSGLIRMKRLRMPGRTRSRVLVPFKDALDLIQKA